MATERPSTVGHRSEPGQRLEVRRGLEAELVLVRAGHDGGCERMLRASLDRRGQVQELGLGHAVRGYDVRDRRPSDGQRAGLVEDDGAHVTGAFERVATTDEDAGLGRAAGADHDRRRRGQAHGARAGDDEHGDGRDEPEREARFRTEDQPGDEGDGGQDQDDGHEDRADAVGQRLDGRLRALRLLDHAHDLRQDGVASDPRGAQDEGAAAIDRRPDDLVARPLGDRHRLAGQHRLVEARGALGDDAVDGHLLPWPHAHEVARLDLLDRDVRLDVPDDDARRPGLQPDQRADGAGRLTLGTRLHPAPEEDEPDDDRAGVEVGLGRPAGLHEQLRPERDRRAVAPGSGRPDGDQRVHGHVAMARGLPRRTQEAPAGPEQDEGRRQQDEAVGRLHVEGTVRPEHDGHDPDRDGQADHGAQPQVGQLPILRLRFGVRVRRQVDSGRLPDRRRSAGRHSRPTRPR